MHRYICGYCFYCPFDAVAREQFNAASLWTRRTRILVCIARVISISLQGSHKYGRPLVIRCFFWFWLILSHRRKAVHLMHATPSCAFCFSCCLHVRQSHVAFSASDFGNWVWCTATLGSWHTLFLQAGSLQVLHVLHFGFEHCGLEQLSQCGVSLLLACRLRIMNVKWELRCSLHTVQG